MEQLLTLSRTMQAHADRILKQTRLMDIWRSVGASPNIVGSLRMGLLMKHRDIDIHVYSSPFVLSDSFRAMAELAADSAVGKITFINLLNRQDECVQWQVEYNDAESGLWVIDIIHMPRGARYDGFFERMADRIRETLTEDTRLAILSLKAQTPDTEKIMGIEYYQAVLRDNVRTWEEFTAWRLSHPVEGIVEWIP